ncbi:ABC transporter permease [Amycolatopsis acidicola]|uniref:ABC transporter permease n=1 Tax=Amycolatopsis acidicola TaxID=2596893 RepID=A0A5N0V286_9PSEU|nr:ABC transporter permease [Amycolatopsis acidicola]KAA9159055.1 ABC transporter permease [Amycolatopsis acidicola]
MEQSSYTPAQSRTETLDDARGVIAAPAPVPAAGRAKQARRRRHLPNRWLKVVSVVSVLVLLAVWQLLAQLGVIDRTQSSSPSDVWHSFAVMAGNGSLGTALLASAKLYGIGLLVSIGIGIVFGLVLGWWRVLGAIFDPWIAILYSTPLIALLPLIIVWFGIGFQGQLVMVVLVSVFPLLVNVMVGTRQADEELLRLAHSFGASQFALVRTIVLPSLVPYMVTGIRLSIGTALIGMVIGEYFEGTDGIGSIILKSGVMLDSSGVFVGIVILAVVALTLTSLIRVAERKVGSWRET